VDDGSALLAQLDSTGWVPKDVVHQVCMLKGVAGGLIATSDGLSVADQLPQELNPENMAAFLPQIFGRMGQYTKELHLGNLSSATLVVGDAPCAIYKTGGIYLVVLGRVKESLPDGILNRIATELANRNP
jgi:predicted regulator of Ras-like GTPase activity (Roadblock/LC7/MglB family)